MLAGLVRFFVEEMRLAEMGMGEGAPWVELKRSLVVPDGSLDIAFGEAQRAQRHFGNLALGRQAPHSGKDLFGFLKSLGISLIPATAPDFFTEDTPTTVLVRQVLGAIAQFEKTSLVAKLKAARDRKKAATGKCGGRRSYIEARPEIVGLAKQLHAGGMSLRKICAELAARGHLTGGRKPYVASAVQAMLAA